MKIIPPSFEILSNLDQQSLATRIEACGRICYKSEDKISAESMTPFIKNIVKRGHNSVLEMGVLTLQIYVDNDSIVKQFYQIIPKFLHLDYFGKKLLISGSIRAFREIYIFHPNEKLVKAMIDFLAARHPLFFSDLEPKRGWVSQEGMQIEKLSLIAVDALPVNLLIKHRHIAVKFYINRAISHEIVRHRSCSYLQESQRYCRYGGSKFGNQVTFIKPLFFEDGSTEYKLWEEAMLVTEKLYLQLLTTSSPQAARTVLPNSCKTELIVYTNLTEWIHILKLRTAPGAERVMREIMIILLYHFKKIFPAVFTRLF